MNTNEWAHGATSAGAAPRTLEVESVAQPRLFEAEGRFVTPMLRATVSLDQRQVATVKVTGVLTPECFGALQRWHMGVMLRAQAAGSILDFRGAAVAVDDRQITLVSDGIGRVDAPIAVVVEAPSEAIFREWAWTRALSGAMRSVFREESKARAWVAARAWIPQAR
jgi:hypothetical protein